MDVTNVPSHPDTDPSVWTESFRVRAFETDVTGHLGVLHLCNYLQEVAGNHARALGVSIEDFNAAGLTWMLSRLHVQIERYPTFGETVRIETWPSGHTGLLAMREFLIYADDNTLIGKGTSAWLIIDIKRRRPIRIPEYIDAITLPERPRPIDDPFNKLPSPKQAAEGPLFSVGYQDLDINQHANSMRYVVWALEGVPMDWRTSHQLSGLEIQFRAEATYGDPIASRMDHEKDSPTMLHGLFEKDSGKELATMRTTWR